MAYLSINEARELVNALRRASSTAGVPSRASSTAAAITVSSSVRPTKGRDRPGSMTGPVSPPVRWPPDGGHPAVVSVIDRDHGPVRVRLSRARGWRLPPGAVSVAYPTRWANPHRPAVRSAAANRRAVEAYQDDLVAGRLAVTVHDVRAALAGKDLACWCAPDLPCHADVLLVIANRPEGSIGSDVGRGEGI